MAHRQVGYDLAPEGDADERRALQPDFPYPGGEGVAEPGHVQDATGLLALAEDGQVGCIDPIVGDQPLVGGDHVAARGDQPVHQYYRGTSLGWAIPEARASTLRAPTGVQIPLIFTERRISGAQVGSPSRRTGRSPPGPDRSGACRSRCIQPLRSGVSTPGRARDPDPWVAYPPPFPR
jgi:hypothetical protein